MGALLIVAAVGTAVLAVPVIALARNWVQRSLAFALLGSVLTVISLLVFADDVQLGADAPYNVWFALPMATVAAGCLGAALISFILRHLDEP